MFISHVYMNINCYQRLLTLLPAVNVMNLQGVLEGTKASADVVLY